MIELATLWPCCKCDAPGIRNLGTQGWCPVHLEQLYAGFDPSVFAFNGKGIQTGPLRPDWGPLYAELTCNACGAGWVGPVGESCTWCAEAFLRTVAWQAEQTLTPPDVDPDDVRRKEALIAWSDRLWVAVEAGIVGQDLAERTLAREVQRGT